MAKKKAAGGKAGKDETPEERQARLDQEASAAKDKELKRAEAARVALRQRQLREQECARINAIKIHNQWRKIMRLSKADELRQQIEILSQNHEREVDRKDAMIQMLDRDLEEAEQQYQLAVHAHMVVIDQLLDLQYTHTASLEAQYNADLAALQEEFEGERAEIQASHARTKKDLQDMAAAMQVEFTDAESDAKQEFESAREELKNRDSEDYNVLKIQLEGIIEELERHFEQAHRAYLEGTEHRNMAFKTLLKNDSEAAKVIEQRMKKLVKLQEELQHWRTKIATNTREWEERNGALRREKELMSRHYAQLKAALDAGRQQQAMRLKALSINAGAAIKDLKKKLEKAESILKLSEVCRKLETEQEKVLPFWSLSEAVPVGESPSTPEEVLQQTQQQQEAEQEAAAAAAAQEEQEARMAAASTSWQGAAASKPLLSSQVLNEQGLPLTEHQALERFFKRYNKVLLDKAAIDQQKQRLEQENGDLRQLLKGFLDGISVNADVLNTPANPLLVVNNRLQLLMTERKKARTRAAADAAAAVAAAAKIAAAGGGAPLVTVHAVSAL